MSNETGKFFDNYGMAIVDTTKQKLLHTAIGLFAKQGYDGASVRDITREVGIKESSFYNHFTSKDELLSTMYNEFNAFMESVHPSEEIVEKAVAAYNVKELLMRRLDDYWVSSVKADIGKLWFTISMEQYRDSRAGELVIKETERMIRMHALLFRKMMESGRIPADDPDKVSVNFVYAMRAITGSNLVRFRVTVGADPIRKKAEGFIDFFLGNLNVV
jgi:AcrR family transcriptional regulator